MCKKDKNLKICEENDVVSVGENEQINFGEVNSCITIVFTLKDGTRVAGHMVQTKGKKTVLENLKKAIGKKKVKNVKIVGQLTAWTDDLENQDEIVARSTKTWSVKKKQELRKMKLYTVQTKYGPLFKKQSAMDKKTELKKYIREQFKCKTATASVKQHEYGTLIY